MDKPAERVRRNRADRYSEIQSGLIAALRAAGELSVADGITSMERQQLRQLNRQLKFYIQKTGNMENNGAAAE